MAYCEPQSQAGLEAVDHTHSSKVLGRRAGLPSALIGDRAARWGSCFLPIGLTACCDAGLFAALPLPLPLLLVLAGLVTKAADVPASVVGGVSGTNNSASSSELGENSAANIASA